MASAVGSTVLDVSHACTCQYVHVHVPYNAIVYTCTCTIHNNKNIKVHYNKYLYTAGESYICMHNQKYQYTKIIAVHLSVRAGGDRKPFDLS